MDLIELKSANGEDILLNPDAIVAVYAKVPPGGRLGEEEKQPYVRFLSGAKLYIDDESYQLLRTAMVKGGER